ncbi:LLM class F420-dependent oxidoreductase [Streptomyces sp. NPDC060022]|uniref:LLM class F420-dependent oxidoreductase n=1 Tax=Streptomyces sp. NPDC060022 TaxID=3347039 RepID=UPI0036AE1B98
MKIGTISLITDKGMSPARLAQELEQRGFSSMFVAEHTHIPYLRETPYPGGRTLPSHYYRTLDPFVALASAAAVTTRIKLGTGVTLAAQRHPIIMAKEVASLDHISNGRLILGIGAGWNREEMRNHGVDPASRMAVLREHVLAMKSIWANDRASFNGSYVSFQDICSWPKPDQEPHPPIFMGGTSAASVDFAVSHCNGWMPIYNTENGRLLKRIAALCAMSSESLGSEFKVIACGVPPEAGTMRSLAEAGVDEILIKPRALSTDDTLFELDRIAAVIT